MEAWPEKEKNIGIKTLISQMGQSYKNIIILKIIK
jgi:hypothetical protein